MSMKTNQEKKVFITSGIRLVAEKDVLQHIPKDTLDSLKALDPHPCFAMMTIGHEGESKGELYEGDPRLGKKLSSWYKQLWPLKAIKEIVTHLKVNKATPVFESHDEGIAMGERLCVGNVIASTKRVIDNVTHAVGIAYINNYGTRDRIKRGELNACSLEATCVFESADNIFKYIVRKVKSLSGVALCNSEDNEPGFENANIMAVVTAMAKADEEDDEDDDKRERKGQKMVTLKDVKEFIEANGTKPDKLFSVEDLTAVPKVIDAFANEHKTELEERDKKIKELDEEIAPLRAEKANGRVEGMIEKSALLKDEYKDIVSYLKKAVHVDIAGIEDAEVAQAAVDKAIKMHLEILPKGFKVKAAKGAVDEDNPDKTEKKDEDKVDYTQADDNELIPGGTAKKKEEKKEE